MLRLFFILLFPLTLSAQLKRFEFSQNKMGSPFNLIFYHTDSAEAKRIAGECFLIVDSLNNIFSDYTSESEVGKLALQPVNSNLKVSGELFEMIMHSKKAWERSGKTFDITIGNLTQLWRKAKKEKRFPSGTEINQAKQSTGFENVIINKVTNTISFTKKGMRLDFGGIVKGYAAQRVIDYLKSKNILIALVDAGGDIAMSDAPPGKGGWSIGINLPEQENELMDQKLELKNCAVATSGDVYNYIPHNGKRYSHIIDPGTSYGVTFQRNVTVIAKDGTTADWLATACSILPIKKALAFAEKENAALLIAIIKNEKIITYKTKKFDSYFQKKLP
jgi:thiamine biosynthesis lipoprotein